MSLMERLAEVRLRIAQAAVEAGRPAESVRLIAVCKGHPAALALEAQGLGVADFGENTAQGLQDKVSAFTAAAAPARWHFIGRLQRNKINAVLKTGAIIHSVDSAELLEALAARVPPEGLRVLVQVNLGDEPQKGGVPMAEAVAFALRVVRTKGMKLLGFMGIPPAEGDPRPHFERLRARRDELVARPEGAGAGELSMGMSHDFETAIACGATMVRVGTSIFGERRAKESA